MFSQGRPAGDLARGHDIERCWHNVQPPAHMRQFRNRHPRKLPVVIALPWPPCTQSRKPVLYIRSAMPFFNQGGLRPPFRTQLAWVFVPHIDWPMGTMERSSGRGFNFRVRLCSNFSRSGVENKLKFRTLCRMSRGVFGFKKPERTWQCQSSFLFVMVKADGIKRIDSQAGPMWISRKRGPKRPGRPDVS